MTREPPLAAPVYLNTFSRAKLGQHLFAAPLENGPVIPLMDKGGHLAFTAKIDLAENEFPNLRSQKNISIPAARFPAKRLSSAAISINDKKR